MSSPPSPVDPGPGIAALHLLGKGVQLYRALREPPMTQRYLAARAGLAQARVSRIENTDTRATLDEVVRLAEVLAVSPVWLIELPAWLHEDHDQLPYAQADVDLLMVQLRGIAATAGWRGVDGRLNPNRERLRTRALHIANEMGSR